MRLERRARTTTVPAGSGGCESSVGAGGHHTDSNPSNNFTLTTLRSGGILRQQKLMNPFSEHTSGETPKDQMAGNVCESRPSSPDRVNASTVPGGRQKRGKTGKYLANFQWGRNRFDMICDGVTASSGWSKGRLKNRPNIICRKRRQRGSVLPRPGHLRPEPQGGLTHNAYRLPRQGRKETTLAGTQWRPRRPKDLVVEVALRGDPVCRYVKPDMLVDVALKQVVDPGAVPGGSTTFNGPAAWKVADTRREAPRGRQSTKGVPDSRSCARPGPPLS